MTTYDFDTFVERHGTDSLKFDRAQSRHRSPDLLSLWVADMDFRTPHEVIEAIQNRAAHGIFGYTEPGDAYFAALCAWMKDHYHWDIDPKSVVVTPGVVFALAAAVCAYTAPGERVLIQQPVYYPFSEVIRENGREIVNAPLVYTDGRYRIDFDAFERAIVESGAKLFLLCNPHNPVGRVWSASELARLGTICRTHNVLVVSDEIHMDFARPGFEHTTLLNAAPDLAEHALICTSASKTFNLAGLQVANIVIPSSQLKEQFWAKVLACGYSQVNTLGLVATQAAYEHGGPWLSQLKDYLEGNWALLEERLQPLSELALVPAQSTYLAWIDCTGLKLAGRDLERFIEDEARLWLDCGRMFGADGDKFIRINLACQRSYLAQALDRLEAAVVARRS